MGDDFLYRQWIKLGDMIGDGLHHEEPWIYKEYRALSKIILGKDPELKDFYKEVRIEKNRNIDDKMRKLLSDKKCDCGGDLKQTRSGSFAVKCVLCGLRYKAKRGKSGNK